MRCRLVQLGVVLLLAWAAAPAHAEPPEPAPEAASPEIERARELYRQGVEHVRRQEWAEALSAFEHSQKLRAHATTTFNVAACERALGQYTRALGTFERAIAQADAQPGSLAPSLRTEAEAMVRQIDELLARVSVTLEPAQAAIAVDGRPLRRRPGSGSPVLVGGVEPPGPGTPPPAARFELVLNPGPHVITLSRRGFSDAVVRVSYAPGGRRQLSLRLDELPATIRVSANVERAIVRVSDMDVGPAPVEILRPAGSYRVLVTRDGFEPYETSVTLNAGGESDLKARLRPESTALTERWWFWAGAVAVVAGGVALTYALTREDPEPPPYDGGSTGWVVVPSNVRF
jgi:hypothetical protein